MEVRSHMDGSRGDTRRKGKNTGPGGGKDKRGGGGGYGAGEETD